MAASVRIVLGLGTAALAQSLLRKLLTRWSNRKNFGGLESEFFWFVLLGLCKAQGSC